jgi:membrane associated rhomboid family serine protease
MIPLRVTDPRTRATPVVVVLIGLNVLAFLYQISLPPRAEFSFVASYALVPLRYADPRWARSVGLDPSDYLPLLSSTFLHGGWLHLIGNMWTLWLFGGAVETRLGRLRFALLYLLCGILASAAHLLANQESRVPVLGASGAIAAVLGAHVTLFPHSRVLLLVPILIIIPLFLPLPTILYVGLWFALQVVEGAGDLLQPQMGGGIAWWAHIGGFLAGIVLIRLISPPIRQGPRGPGRPLS